MNLYRMLRFACPCLIATSICLSATSTFGQSGGTWTDPRLTPLPTDKLGPFVKLSEGKILAVDSAATFVSADQGKTWSEPRPLSGAIEKNIKVSNERALFRTKDGSIIAAFMNLNERHWTWDDELHDAPGAKLPAYVMRSLDNGVTWQNVQKLHESWTGAIRDMIQTKDGRIIFTVMKMQHDPGRHSVLTYSSDDDGQTWKASNLIDLGGKGNHGGVTEPTLTELKDGRIWMLIRTNWGEFWSAYSHDGGKFWRTIQPSGIPASSAPAMLRRLQSSRLVLIWNRPFPEGKTEWKMIGGNGLWSETPVSNFREELSIAWSQDEGKTWTRPEVIAHNNESPAKGSRRWLSYPYLFEPNPGELWLTTMQGGLRVKFNERDFADRVVVAFGDSTTATRGSLNVYAAQLQAAFPDDLIINAGVGGHNTDHARTRFEQDVLSKKPDLVVIQFGINDAAIDVWKDPPAKVSRVSLEKYEANLRHFIEQLKGKNCRVILMTPNPLRWTPKMKEMYGKPPYDPGDADGFNFRLRLYAEKMKSVAAAENVELVDIYQAFEAYGDDRNQTVDQLLLDGVHPNENGHRLVAEMLQKQINEIPR